MDATPPAPPQTKTLYDGPAPTGKVGPTGLRKIVPARHGDGLKASPMLILWGLLAVAGLGGYLYLQAHPDLPLKAQVDGAITALASPLDLLKEKVQLPSAARSTLAQHADPRIADGRSSGAPSPKTAKRPDATSKEKSARTPTPLPEPIILKNPATVFLANGERITGELVSDTPEGVVLRWEYGDASFKREEVVRLIKHDEGAPLHAAGDRVTVFLANGGKMTGDILYDFPEELILAFEGGEVTFKKSEIERVEPADPLAP